MKYIPLTQKQIASVRDADYERINANKWCAQKTREGDYYAVRTICHPDGTRERVYMHREVIGALPGEEVDHKDLNKLNNDLENLRRATKSQSQFNKRKHKDNTSGYKGVYFDGSPSKKNRPWYARIKFEGKRIRLGYFATPEEAARVYDVAAVKYHGAFACLNFPNLLSEYRNELGLE